MKGNIDTGMNSNTCFYACASEDGMGIYNTSSQRRKAMEELFYRHPAKGKFRDYQEAERFVRNHYNKMNADNPEALFNGHIMLCQPVFKTDIIGLNRADSERNKLAEQMCKADMEIKTKNDYISVANERVENAEPFIIWDK